MTLKEQILEQLRQVNAHFDKKVEQNTKKEQQKNQLKPEFLTKLKDAMTDAGDIFNLGNSKKMNSTMEKLRKTDRDISHVDKARQAHEFLLELRKDPALKLVIDKFLSDVDITHDYANEANKRKINTLFNKVIKAPILSGAIQKEIQGKLFDEKGEIRPKFTGTKDEVEKSIYALCDAVYESKKQHAAYSELKWPAFMLWGAIFRFVVSTLAEKDPVYLYLLEPEKKLDNSSTRFLPMRG